MEKQQFKIILSEAFKAINIFLTMVKVMQSSDLSDKCTMGDRYGRGVNQVAQKTTGRHAKSWYIYI